MPIYSQIRFTGYSMYPFLKPGDKLIIREMDFRSLHIGDIVLIRYGDIMVAHRLVRILPDFKAIFKGDSLLDHDSVPVGPKDIVGRVDAIVRKNRFISLRSSVRLLTGRIYAFLSLYGLTPGIVRLRLKRFINSMMQLKNTRPSYENHIFLNLLKGGDTGFSHVEGWVGILKTADRERVAGILYQNLKGADIPYAISNELKEYYLRIAAQNLLVISALERLEKSLETEKVEVMALKGASLIEGTYKAVGYRPLDDIDLMVRKEDQSRFEDILCSLGYEKNPVSPSQFRKGGISIDLHTHALNVDRISGRKSLIPLGMGVIWDKSVALRPDFNWIRKPDESDNILLLAQHYMKHSFSCLIWLYDIYMLLKEAGPSGWSRLHRRSMELSQEKSLSYVFFLLNGFLNLSPPPGTGFEDVRYRLSTLERGILKARVKGRSIDGMGVLMAVFCIKGAGPRMRFIWESLFPGRSIIRSEFYPHRKGRGLFFYPRRILSLVLIGFRQISIIIGTLIKG